MQLNKPKKSSSKQSSSNLFDSDFASGFEDSKFDKFKPAIKALVVVILLVGAAWGAVAYFTSTDTESDANKDYTTSTTQQDNDKLAQCTLDMEAKNPIPKSGGDSFYPKLIAYYDAQIDCYDQYPNASSVVSRSSLEYARDSALNSSGGYKDTYTTAVGGSGSNSYSSKNSVTGCDYSLSESEYLACSDKYYAVHGSSGGTSSKSTDTDSAPSTAVESPGSSASVAWCSSKKVEVDNLYSQYQSARNKADSVRTELSKVNYARPAGFTGTQSQLDAWRVGERQRLQDKLSPLQSAEQVALRKYNSVQSEYNAKSCY